MSWLNLSCLRKPRSIGRGAPWACVAALLLTQPADASEPLHLETAPPPEVGRLERCTEASGWQPHPEAVCLRVAGRGGCADQGQVPDVPLPAEQCFRLMQGREVLVQGAVIKPQSARLLRIPVLVVRQESGHFLVELMSDWPAVQAAMPPWLPRLARITGPHDVRLPPLTARSTP